MKSGLPERDEMFLALAQEKKLLSGGRVFSLRQEHPFYPDKSIGELAALKGFLTPDQTDEIYRLVEEKLKSQAPPAPPPEPPPEPAPSPVMPAPAVSAAPEPEPPKPAVAVQVNSEGRQMIGDENVRSFTTLEQYLEFARAHQASDLHLSSGYPPFVRRFGEFCFLDHPPLTSDEVGDLIFPHLDAAQRTTLEKSLNLEMSLDIPGQGRYRTTVIRQRLGWDGCFRVIQSHIPTVTELGFPETVLRLADYRQGMILITGPGGCGKTTTLAALAEYINTMRHEHIITLEQPIEYVFVPKKSHITQRQVGTHTESYQRALRAALREDPDVILMGEMRDLETIALAITAAETGHLVLATLHTTTAARTISRILDSFPPHQQPQIRTMIAESLRGIVCQQLIPRLDRTGVALAIEILVVTPGISSLIREMKLHQVASATQTGKRLGMVRMDESLMDLYQKGIISIEEAYARADDKRMFAPLLVK